MEILELKNTIIKIKNLLDGFNRKMEMAKKSITESENRATEITQSKQHRENRVKNNKQRLRVLWDKNKISNICVIRISKED